MTPGFTGNLGLEPSFTTIGSISSSTPWKVNIAVLPSNLFTSFGSSTPGNCTTIRFEPCLSIVGSLVPVSSILCLITSMDSSTILLE